MGSSDGFWQFNQLLTQTVQNAGAAHSRDGKLTGVATGLSALDRLLGGLHKSDLIVLAGRPSMGKCMSAAIAMPPTAPARARCFRRPPSV